DTEASPAGKGWEPGRASKDPAAGQAAGSSADRRCEPWRSGALIRAKQMGKGWWGVAGAEAAKPRAGAPPGVPRLSPRPPRPLVPFACSYLVDPAEGVHDRVVPALLGLRRQGGDRAARERGGRRVPQPHVPPHFFLPPALQLALPLEVELALPLELILPLDVG